MPRRLEPPGAHHVPKTAGEVIKWTTYASASADQEATGLRGGQGYSRRACWLFKRFLKLFTTAQTAQGEPATAGPDLAAISAGQSLGFGQRLWRETIVTKLV